MKKTTYTLLAFGTVALAAASLLSSCIKENPDSPGWEYFPDMYRSPSLETNMASMHDSVLVNGVWMKDTAIMANMLPPAGTIPRGFTPFPYANDTTGDKLASLYWRNPYTVTDQFEEEGKFLYERFCVYCHGAAGDGNGKLVESQKYASAPPNYATVHGKGQLTDGHIYHVITYGKGVMGSHASQLTPEERWKVVAYVERLGRGGKAYSEWQKEMAAKPAADSVAKEPAKKP
jgi:mono/diheme cytochrome c family protein